jgi:hypothetical protein
MQKYEREKRHIDGRSAFAKASADRGVGSGANADWRRGTAALPPGGRTIDQHGAMLRAPRACGRPSENGDWKVAVTSRLESLLYNPSKFSNLLNRTY